MRNFVAGLAYDVAYDIVHDFGRIDGGSVADTIMDRYGELSQDELRIFRDSVNRYGIMFDDGFPVLYEDSSWFGEIATCDDGEVRPEFCELNL